MTQEEKAKRYDEAYKKVAVRFGSNVADEIFLKENEDERVRKALIELVQGIYMGCCTEEACKERDMFLAWLEKQGQKPVIEMKSAEESLGIDSDTYNKIVDECIYGEQKPAEWTADDEEELKIALNTLEEAGQYSSAKWLKNVCLVPQTMQKPAWSEEDETTKNNISHIIRQYDKISKRENQPCYYVGDCLLWMQNIKDRVLPQPKQEWGEEDTSLCTRIQGVLSICKSHGLLSPDLYKEMRDGLKFLKERYTWKPSEEQIKALRESIGIVGQLTPRGECLKELLEQLKKLREE